LGLMRGRVDGAWRTQKFRQGCLPALAVCVESAP
jgi:hypothetical protein